MRTQLVARIESSDLRALTGEAMGTGRIEKGSPRLKARLASVFFLLTILAGIFAQMFISGRLVVQGDAAATASNILAHRDFFQLGFTVYLIEMACQITLTAIFYALLKPVSSSLSLLAAFFGLIGCAIKTLSRLFYIVPLLILAGSGGYLSVFNVEQLQALALLSLKVNDQAAGIALIFFGFSTLLNGYLIVRSTFLPRILGVFSVIGGLGWLTFLYPPLGENLFSYVLAIGLIGGVSQCLWLFVKGVDVSRWEQQASGSA